MHLVGAAATTAVVAGTATAVSGGMRRRQQQQAMQQQQAVQQEQAAAAPAPEADEPSYIDELQELAKLRDQGVLTDEEFEAKKKQILGI
jgi:hypothetical protein